MNRKNYVLVRAAIAAFIIVGVIVTVLFDQMIWSLLIFALGFGIIQIVNSRYKKGKEEQSRGIRKQNSKFGELQQHCLLRSGLGSL